MAFNDYYVCRTPEGIFAGMVAPASIPSWIVNQPVNTWGVVPSTNLLSSLDPKNDPLINPAYPASPEWYGVTGFASLAVAYCGWVYDFVHKKLRTGLNGGHQDYLGNDEYGININSESPSWYRMRLPSGAIGNILTTKDGQEASGFYSDGQPRAIHSYNKQLYIRGIGLVVSVQGNTAYSGQAGPNRPLFYDDNGMFTGIGATNPNVNGQTSGAGACYDPTRHCVYMWGTATGRLQKYDIATNAWSQLGPSVAVNGGSALVYLAEHDCLLWFNNFLTNGFAIYDLITNQYHYPTVVGSYAGGQTKPTGRTQPVLVVDGEIAWWNNASQTTLINKMTYEQNPRTDVWNVSQYPVAPENSTTPSISATEGTFGRFFHDPELKIFGLINAVNQPIYFYRYA